MPVGGLGVVVVVTDRRGILPMVAAELPSSVLILVAGHIYRGVRLRMKPKTMHSGEKVSYDTRHLRSSESR